MRLHKAGCGHRHPPDFWIDRPLGSPNWLLLVTKTPGRFTVRGEERLARANSMVLFREGTPQSYGAAGEDYCDDWMHFAPDETDLATIETLGIPIDEPALLGDTVRISDCIREIYREWRVDGPLSSGNIDLYFGLILNRIREALDARQQGFTIHYRRLLEIRADIYLYPAQPWSVDRVADALTLSRSTSQHLYRQVFGLSISEDVIQSRLAQAKHLLEVGNAPVYRVAEECGYASDVHFIRQFRQLTGTTPLQYRLSHRA